MYSWELERFIRERNYQIGGEDLQKVISVEENPQLKQITFYPRENRYEMWDVVDHHYAFTVLPSKIEKEASLIRKRQKGK